MQLTVLEMIHRSWISTQSGILESVLSEKLNHVSTTTITSPGISSWALWAESTTKDYIRVENRLESVSKLFVPEVIISHISFSQTTTQILSTISERKHTKIIKYVLKPIYIPRALNTGTCIEQGDLFHSAGLHRYRCWPQLTQEKLERGFGKTQVNGPEG